MILKAIVETTDGLPDEIKDFYEPVEGVGFKLKVEPAGGYELDNIQGLKSALGKERTTREALEKSVAKFKDLDADKAREAMEKLEELSKIDPEKEADKIASTKFEAAKSELLKRHEAEIKAREERISKLNGFLQETLVDQEAIREISEAKGSVDLLLPIVRKYMRVKELDSGKFFTEVVDDEGNGRIADAKGSPMTTKDLVAELRASEKFGRAFDASGTQGSGKQPITPAAGGAGNQSGKGSWVGGKSDRLAAIATKFPDLPVR